METEIWKDIPGYEGLYRISSIGNKVESYGFRKKIRILATCWNDGYIMVNLSKDRIQKWYLVHRLKAIVFIPNIENKEQVNHIDGNKSNNDLSNLEWVTRSENMRHAYRIGLLKDHPFVGKSLMKGKFGKHNPNSKTVMQYAKDGTFIKEWGSVIDAKQELGISGISEVCRGKYKTSGGYSWMYK